MLRHNPLDPLIKSGPDQQYELFRRFSTAAAGFSTAEVIGAATNLVINALRQAHATRDPAEHAYDEHAARAKGLLLNHYDTAGRKKGIFPYDQEIVMPHLVAKDRF